VNVQILVDGYNVILRDGTLSHLSKEDQRESLIRTLRGSAASRIGRGKISVVFDARDSLIATHDSAGGIAVVYAPDADDEIVRLAKRAGKECTVVTDDMRLRARLSQDVGRHIQYRDTTVVFTARPEKGHRERGHSASGTASAEPGGADKRISAKDKRALNDELMELWGDEDSPDL